MLTTPVIWHANDAELRGDAVPSGVCNSEQFISGGPTPKLTRADGPRGKRNHYEPSSPRPIRVGFNASLGHGVGELRGFFWSAAISDVLPYGRQEKQIG